MQLLDFITYHEPALSADPVRYNLLVGLFARFRAQSPDALSTGILTWTLGAPGACAMKTPGRSIILGQLSKNECAALAEESATLDYPGVIGSDDTAPWFRERAEQLGMAFGDAIPQSIQSLSSEPIAPNVTGSARLVTSSDFETFSAWTLAFYQEAVPHDPVPDEASLKTSLETKQHWFWIVDDHPVAIASIARQTETVGVIGPVYTPPAHRNHGYAGAVTAAVASHIFASGRSTACLYTNLRNPASNRCYEKLGFRTLCTSWHIVRTLSANPKDTSTSASLSF